MIQRGKKEGMEESVGRCVGVRESRQSASIRHKPSLACVLPQPHQPVGALRQRLYEGLRVDGGVRAVAERSVAFVFGAKLEGGGATEER